jgi:hypothetical protein
MSKISSSNVRALVRSLTVLVTAFGLKLTGEQVASIQLVVESLLRVISSKKEA